MVSKEILITLLGALEAENIESVVISNRYVACVFASKVVLLQNILPLLWCDGVQSTDVYLELGSIVFLREFLHLLRYFSSGIEDRGSTLEL
jgi:hypothetical protein